ncbi:TonB-dependent receptor [Novosphingobium sp.]|uniref:TonB-dependent receptor n=1 Tax=Novosphingobium sp. TaxID=1874826 RepID=UPI00286E3ADD|nr:TonB-dependent receptor [Novosphingobium sp.]
MRNLITALLASTALLPQVAFAADDAEAAASIAAGEAEIVVLGKGETKQVQEVSQRDIAVLLPGTSVIRAIEKLPSVNIQSADAFGNYEWSTRVTIRSFNQNQLGFNFDGIPLGDMTYGNHNGLHISRVVSPENVGSVRVTQGAGALGTQSSNNLGGTVETFSMDPLDRLAVQANATYGSDETMRGFVRVNMGSTDGPRGFVSYGYGSTDKYRGTGQQDQHMVNAKVVLPIGAATLDAWFSYSDRREQDYQDMSLDMLSRLGYDWDNTYPDYARAILYADIGNNRGETGAAISNAAAGTVYPGNVTTVDDAYFDASGLRKDTVAAIGFKSPIGDNVTVALRGYYHHNRGMGLWATPYVASPNGVPISIRTTEYEIDRGGVFGKLEWKTDKNALTVGGWYETNSFNQARRFYGLDSRTSPGRSFREYPTNPFFTQWEFDFDTQTLQYFVEDRIDLGPVKVNIGWKGFKVTNKATAVVAASFPQGKIDATDWFQPSVGVNLALGGNAEMFASFTQSTRAFASATTTGPFSTNQTGFNAIVNTLKPETSDTYEVGARYNSGAFNGVIGAYVVNFHDRLLSAASGPSIVGSPSVLQNVGAVRSIGFEAVGDLKLGSGFGLFASYSYTDATYRNDVFNLSGTLLAAIKGKTVVDSPKHMLRGELTYDQGALFGRIGVNYMSERFFTYTNDRSVPARTIVDASIGYRVTKDIEVQVNATNLFDTQYIGTINSGGTGNSGDRQTLLVGAPQQFFVTLKAGF